MMEKYYCDLCRLLYSEEQECEKCGSLAKNKIFIEVQMQKESKK